MHLRGLRQRVVTLIPIYHILLRGRYKTVLTCYVKIVFMECVSKYCLYKTIKKWIILNSGLIYKTYEILICSFGHLVVICFVLRRFPLWGGGGNIGFTKYFHCTPYTNVYFWNLVYLQFVLCYTQYTQGEGGLTIFFGMKK